MQTLSELSTTFLLNAVWQAALITLAAAVASRLLMGVSVRYRYLTWVAALVLSLAVPAVTSLWQFGPDTVVTELAPATASNGGQIVMPLTGTLPGFSEAAGSWRVSLPIGLAIAIFAIWILFTLYRAAGLLRAWFRTRAIVRGARRVELTGSILEAIGKCSSVTGDRLVEVLFSSAVPVPVTIGYFSPVVILPEVFLYETDGDVLLTAIGHELVHVKRRDYALNLLLETICIPLSFHPLVRYSRRQMNHVRELCCDEVVASRLLKAEAYARSLINIAGSAPTHGRLSPIITVGITDAENLEVRIMSLLRRSKMSSTKKGVLTFAAVLILAVPLVVAAYLSPEVNITSASALPEAQPTVPVEELEKKDVLRKITRDDDREIVERKLFELRRDQLDPNLTDKQKIELDAMEQRLRSKIAASEEVEYTEEAFKEKLDRVAIERREIEKLAMSANIKMDQAIQIALGSHPGKLADNSIGKMNDEVVYRILVRDENGKDDGDATLVVVSGVDGRIVKSERFYIKSDIREVQKP